MKRLAVLFALSLPCALYAGDLPPPVAAVPETVDDGGPLFASPTRKDHIGRIVAPVMINGLGPFRLVVDTGASHTTVSPELLAKLGLTPLPDFALMLNGVTGAEEVPAVLIDRLQAGDLVVQGSHAPVVRSSIMAGADGILGVAGLTRERISVDFRHDRVIIARSRANDGQADMLRLPAARIAGGLLMVAARIGGVRTRAIIDTGAERSLGNLALRDALRLRKRLAPPRSTFVFGTTADIATGDMQRVPTVWIGTATIEPVDLIFGDFHIFKVWDLERQPTVLIGMDILGTVSELIIDYRRREVYVRA